jgi:hypothetical protein
MNEVSEFRCQPLDFVILTPDTIKTNDQVWCLEFGILELDTTLILQSPAGSTKVVSSGDGFL